MRIALHRQLFQLASIIALASASASVAAAELDPATAEGNIAINRKIHCSMEDASPQVYQWFGRAYSRVPGERDRHLFNLDGMNIRQCVGIEDPDRGPGYRMVSRELMLYLDPQTNEVMDSFANPWTGMDNSVIHVANDPVNQRPSFGRTAEGEDIPFNLQDMNGKWLMRVEVPLFYTNPLGGDYQNYVGGTYHAVEIFDFNGDTAELLDAGQPVAYPVVSWVRIAPWLPWMEMGSRPGTMYFNAMGRKLENFEQLSATMQSEIAENYPEYAAPPGLDDTRPNETSWTYMKKIIDGAGQ